MAEVAGTAFTIADLEAKPDDDRRYELIGGAIVVTPALEPVHQRVSRRLLRLIEDACPPGHEAFSAPIDYDLPRGQRVQPDIVVGPDGSVGPKRLAGPALLVVEIVSPGSRTNDLVTKPAVYADAGVQAYWVIDPEAEQFLSYRIVDDSYELVVDQTRGTVQIDWPIAVSFSLADVARR